MIKYAYTGIQLNNFTRVIKLIKLSTDSGGIPEGGATEIGGVRDENLSTSQARSTKL